METASLNGIKKTLAGKDQQELLQLCLRMAKYKKENKELLTYLLFESDHEQGYIEDLAKQMDEMFDGIISSTNYQFAKHIRKILRSVNKHIKYSGLPATQVELLMHFCSHLLPIVKSKRHQTALVNMYAQQIRKINTALGKLHEDLQYDYIREMERQGLVWEP